MQPYTGIEPGLFPDMLQQQAMVMQPQMQMGHPPQFNNLYKTQLCKHYEQTGICHVGARCHFAHGETELRKREDVTYCSYSHRIATTNRSTNEDAQHPIQQLQDSSMQVL